MTFRAVFCDIDGTLLDSTHALRPATASAVNALHASGVPFILVSARSPSGVLPIQKNLGISGPIVCYGGALVMNETGDPVHSLAMDMHRVTGIKRRIRISWPDITATVYSNDNWFVDDRTDPRVVTEADITGAGPTEISSDAMERDI